MKAKEYQRRLLELLAAQTPEADAAYRELVNALHRECLEITQTKLQQIKHDRLARSDRYETAYKAGYEKWKAVWHALSVALNRPPPAPLYRSGMFLAVLNANVRKYVEKEITLEQLRTYNAKLDEIVFANGARPCTEFDARRAEIRAAIGSV
jgi:hypothetical protein